MPRPRRGLRSVRAAAPAPALVRAAVYVRKSTTAGLDSDFTSLDNQRQRAEAYAKSQGWNLLSTTYSDAGLSGGKLDRPALQQLLSDVENGLIDIIVVYKLDRLSRSLLDFLNIHRFLEKHDASIVSVTEPIDTSTPMGRGFVNVLLSFAQIEREVAAERTRDKIQAARRRGRWTGGIPPLGYDVAPEGGRLTVKRDEVETVRLIYQLYIERRSLVQVTQELNRRCCRTKSWVTKNGTHRQGQSWNKVTVRRVLTDPLYIGMQKLGRETFKGEHPAIVTKKLFDEVQRLMNDNRVTRGASSRNRYGFLLRGLLRCSACDAAMVPSTTKSRGRVYRYYICRRAQKNGHATCPTRSLKADDVEAFAVNQIKRIGADPQLQDETFRQAVAQVKAQRRGLRAEVKRIERDLVTVRAEVEPLVAAVCRTTGPAGDAIAAELEKAQERLATLDNRKVEIQDELATLKAQEIDRSDLTRALEEFDPIWDALLTPERERVLKLLIERIDYDGGTKQLSILWRLAGFGELAEELS